MIDTRRHGDTRSWAFISVLLLVYLACVVALDGLSFPPSKDETHFWPTSLAFSRYFPSAVGTLRSYNELNTPLPFVVFGGRLSFPYFLGAASHLYTDIMASFFVLWGVVFHVTGRHNASALSFILAIACRQ